MSDSRKWSRRKFLQFLGCSLATAAIPPNLNPPDKPEPGPEHDAFERPINSGYVDSLKGVPCAPSEAIVGGGPGMGYWGHSPRMSHVANSDIQDWAIGYDHAEPGTDESIVQAWIDLPYFCVGGYDERRPDYCYKVGGCKYCKWELVSGHSLGSPYACRAAYVISARWPSFPPKLVRALSDFAVDHDVDLDRWNIRSYYNFRLTERTMKRLHG